MNELIKATREFVYNQSIGETTGHDWWHIVRVTNIALEIGKTENADLQLIELAALLHDIDDWKFNNSDERKAFCWLKKHKLSDKTIEMVLEIIENLSFKGANVQTPMKTLEGKIVQDADRLDAIGAIGIARTFAYGGSRQREMYNPEEEPKLHSSFDSYKKSQSHTINHFYEKLLLLKDRMNTKTGKKMAENRHAVMEEFLSRFFEEWKGLK